MSAASDHCSGIHSFRQIGLGALKKIECLKQASRELTALIALIGIVQEPLGRLFFAWLVIVCRTFQTKIKIVGSDIFSSSPRAPDSFFISSHTSIADWASRR